MGGGTRKSARRPTAVRPASRTEGAPAGRGTVRRRGGNGERRTAARFFSGLQQTRNKRGVSPGSRHSSSQMPRGRGSAFRQHCQFCFFSTSSPYLEQNHPICAYRDDTPSSSFIIAEQESPDNQSQTPPPLFVSTSLPESRMPRPARTILLPSLHLPAIILV